MKNQCDLVKVTIQPPPPHFVLLNLYAGGCDSVYFTIYTAHSNYVTKDSGVKL